MVSIRLDSSTDSLELSSVELTGVGIQALKGATGFGLPPVAMQWAEGAGDGKKPRGRRTLARTMDVPILIRGANRLDLESLVSRFARMFANGCTMTWTDGARDEWYLDVYREGGGDWVYGEDTIGENDLQTVVTLTSGDPFWKRARTQTQFVQDGVRGLLANGASLASLQVGTAQTFGTILLDNPYDASAIPVWTLAGPLTDFQAVSPSGELLRWSGSLAAGETLILDARNSSVIDGTGADRYTGTALAPRFWRIPAGTSTAQVLASGTSAGTSSITCTWQPRRWAVI